MNPPTPNSAGKFPSILTGFLEALAQQIQAGKWLVLVTLVTAGAAQADVVLDQIGGADDFTGSPISDVTNFSITWTAGFTGVFDSVDLRIYNVSTTSAITALTLNFSLADGTGVAVTGTNTYGGGAVNDISDYDFDLSPLSLSFLEAESGSVFFHLNTALSSGGSINWSTTDRGVDTSDGWTGGVTPGVGSGQFKLSASPAAVPEPSVYGAGIAALLGGMILRRRRQV